MNAKFEISDDKLSFEITGGSLQDALRVLLEKLPRANRTKLAAQDTREQPRREPIRAEKTVGRNDPCPCGSGKKYKNCHGRNA